MKYLRRFNEASINANDYKFRRDVLPSEIDDILLPLKDELIHYKVTFPTFPTNDKKKIEIDFEIQDHYKIIDKMVIKGILEHLITYLSSENFELSYYWTENESSSITTPEFNFREFFELIPDYFNQMYLTFVM
jgi:hypothetical protein